MDILRRAVGTVHREHVVGTGRNAKDTPIRARSTGESLAPCGSGCWQGVVAARGEADDLATGPAAASLGGGAWAPAAYFTGKVWA